MKVRITRRNASLIVAAIVFAMLGSSAVDTPLSRPPRAHAASETYTTYMDNVGFQHPRCYGFDAGCVLDNRAGGPFPAVWPGKANSCRYLASEVKGMNTDCRAVFGLDDGGSCGAPCADHRDFEIVADHQMQYEPIDSAHLAYGYGMVIGGSNGVSYEGCQIVSSAYVTNPPKFEALCDFAVSHEKMSAHSNNSGGWYLSALWNSSRGAFYAGACAIALATIDYPTPWNTRDVALCYATTALP